MGWENRLEQFVTLSDIQDNLRDVLPANTASTP